MDQVDTYDFRDLVVSPRFRFTSETVLNSLCYLGPVFFRRDFIEPPHLQTDSQLQEFAVLHSPSDCLHITRRGPVSLQRKTPRIP